MRAEQIRTYERSSSVVFLKTDAQFGGLSNMAGGYPLRVAGIRILTSEALYQSCRFPHMPEVQRMIIDQKSPMTAKMKVKPYRADSRPDWDQVRVKIMRWCLRVKLAQNWSSFSALLLSTGEGPIVEESRKDGFWGAKSTDDNSLIGMNVLGRLLMELRELVRTQDRAALSVVEPAAIPNFLLCGTPIGTVGRQTLDGVAIDSPKTQAGSIGSLRDQASTQPSLFDAPMVKEAAQPEYGLSDQRASSVADLKPYAEYRASSHAWVGDVPNHWQVLPNRALFSEVKDRNHPDEEMLSVTITRGIVKQKTLLAGSSKKDSSNLDKSAYKLVQPRDIAYNKMRAWQGAIGASALRGIISPAYVVMRLRGQDDLPSYFHHLYRTPQFAKEAERWSYGITSDMWSLRPEHFKMIYTPVPPPAEQAAIVRFLNWAHSRLDRTIHAKRKVIALLNEQKQAIIRRAVIRGLDPSVPLKPSGIPWLGDIPQHWEAWPLRRCISIRSGDFADPLRLRSAPSESHPIPVVGGNGVMGFTDRANSKVTTIVIGRVGALCGNVHLVKGDAWITDNALRVIRINDFSPAFLSEQLRVMDLNRLANANAQPLVTSGVIKSQRVAKPPREEQDRIAQRLPELTVSTDTEISRLNREIELLREYRIRLAADVVTGKLDVREAAAKLPAEELATTDAVVLEAELAEDEAAAMADEDG